MGTNYYARIEQCQSCGRYDDRHIGKQSGGWPFLLSPHHESWQEWKTFLEHGDITVFDEYGREVPKEEFFKLVEATGRKGNPEGASYVDDRYERRDGQAYRISKREGFS